MNVYIPISIIAILREYSEMYATSLYLCFFVCVLYAGDAQKDLEEELLVSGLLSWVYFAMIDGTLRLQCLCFDTRLLRFECSSSFMVDFLKNFVWPLECQNCFN